jgi:hypothetical protein
MPLLSLGAGKETGCLPCREPAGASTIRSKFIEGFSAFQPKLQSSRGRRGPSLTAQILQFRASRKSSQCHSISTPALARLASRAILARVPLSPYHAVLLQLTT